MLWHDPTEEPTYSQVVELDLVDGRADARRAAPAAGPRAALAREDGVPRLARHLRRRLRRSRTAAHDKALADTFPASDPTDRAGARRRRPSPSPTRCPSRSPGPAAPACRVAGTDYELEHGSVVIAAITSCTNTSNPQVMVGAGLLAKKAVERGLRSKPWVKTSLAPGSKVVTEYYDKRRPDAVPRAARLPHRRLRLHDLHRQLGAAARGDLGRGREGRPRRLLRALRQPQLRGAHPPGGEGELPRLAAARRRLRARGPDGPRPARGAARRGRGRQRRLPARPLADARPRSRRRSRPPFAARCSSPPTPTSSPATSSGATCRSPRASSSRGSPTRRTSAGRRTSTACRRRRSRSRTSRARAASSCSATRSRPTTSRRPARSGPTARPASTWSSTASSGRTSTPTARAAATTR